MVECWLDSRVSSSRGSAILVPVRLCSSRHASRAWDSCKPFLYGCVVDVCAVEEAGLLAGG